MNNARRKKLDRAAALVAEAQEIVSACAEEEREAYDNMSESLQNGERGQMMSEAADALESAADALTEVGDQIQSAMEA